MSARQITLPFRARRAETQTDANADLVGRSYEDGLATITVVETCFNDQSRVMVKRDLDGHTWSMPAWLMRFVFKETTQKRAA
ncbi:MAG TPA: hypothetical protein VHQ64_09315 [Pyrinomonadaceae bacterium]|jgi:hypothetical protein|nr:hypothetical protein [Pyrinomonadaceae bacterium]